MKARYIPAWALLFCLIAPLFIALAGCSFAADVFWNKGGEGELWRGYHEEPWPEQNERTELDFAPAIYWPPGDPGSGGDAGIQPVTHDGDVFAYQIDVNVSCVTVEAVVEFLSKGSQIETLEALNELIAAGVCACHPKAVAAHVTAIMTSFKLRNKDAPPNTVVTVVEAEDHVGERRYTWAGESPDQIRSRIGLKKPTSI